MIRKMVVDMAIPESVIEKVISFQFTSAADALRTYKSVELSGFGKFLMTDKKVKIAVRRYTNIIEKYKRMQQEEGISDKQKKRIGIWIASNMEKMEAIMSLKNKEQND